MKKKNLIITIISLFVILIGICSIIAYCRWNYIPEYNPEEFVPNIKQITSNTKILDANINHNQAIDVINYAKSQGLKTPPILINIDTHSDIYLNLNTSNLEAEISDWINEYIAQNPEVKEIYWIMPREEAKNPFLQIEFGKNDRGYIRYNTALYGNSLKKSAPFKFLKTPLTKKAYKQEFLFNPISGKMNEVADESAYKKAKILFNIKNPNLRKITVITCTEDTLPDFKGKTVFLSIDADYFSNSGFDTTGNFINNKKKKQIAYSLFSLMKTLKEKNVRPEIINLTLSPEYVPVEDHQDIIDFYNRVFEITKLPDAVREYKYSIDKNTTEEYKLFRKNQILYFIRNGL